MTTNTSRQKLSVPSSSSYSYRHLVDSLITELAQALATSDRLLNPLSSTDPKIRHILLTLHALFPNELLPALDILDRRLILVYTTSQNEAKDRSDNQHNDSRSDTTNAEHVSSPSNAVDESEAAFVSQDRNKGTDSTGKSFVQDPAPIEDSESVNASEIGITTTIHEAIHARRNVSSQPRQSATSNAKSVVYCAHSGRQQTVLRSKWRDTMTETARYEVRLLPWSCSCPAFAFSAFPASNHTQAVQTALNSDIKTNDTQVGGISLGDDLPICKHILACLLVNRSNALAQFAEIVHLTDDELHGWAAGYGD